MNPLRPRIAVVDADAVFERKNLSLGRTADVIA
jgi:hypothetical protein